MRRVYLFDFRRHVQTGDADQLKFRLWNVVLAPLEVGVHKLYRQMVGLALQAVVRGHLAEPIEQYDTHLQR